ncbi:MAG: ribonuclease P protein subunit [Candidatus Aenigmarchaeota archaeon]|nr:ribonuclease P protein subunit [Candidatus Aenigmarchaeota archaeon]
MRTPGNILMHEFIGLECGVASSLNAAQSGLKGRIADETMKSIIIETPGGMKSVPKKGTLFVMKVGACDVAVKGDAIIARPEDRIKKRSRKW